MKKESLNLETNLPLFGYIWLGFENAIAISEINHLEFALM